MDKTWYFDSFNGILNPISAIRTMCDSIRTNARRDGMGAIEDSGRKLYDLCNDMEHQIHATINLMNFSKDHGIKSSTVYSDSFDEMIQKDFTYKGNKYTWNDLDCVYYNDNGDEEDFFMEIPEGAITSAKKPIKSATGDSSKLSYPGINKVIKQLQSEEKNDLSELTNCDEETWDNVNEDIYDEKKDLYTGAIALLNRTANYFYCKKNNDKEGLKDSARRLYYLITEPNLCLNVDNDIKFFKIKQENPSIKTLFDFFANEIGFGMIDIARMVEQSNLISEIEQVLGVNQSKQEKKNKIDPETEIRTLWKNASKQSKVKIMKDNGWNSYIRDELHWSVTLDTEDEYKADDFRNAIDNLWNKNSGEYSYDDIQGIGDVHLGVERYGDFSEMCGNDVYEDLDPKIRDKYVVYCEPSKDYKHRREMDW